MVIVVVDPGHGGFREVGASSPNNAKDPDGLLEKTVTRKLGRRTRDRLSRRGIEVHLTRDTHRNLGLAKRAALAKVHRADAFVSIHPNGFNGKAQGTEAFHHTRLRTGAYKASTSEAPASAILGWLVTAQRLRPEMLAGGPEQLRTEEAIVGLDESLDAVFLDIMAKRRRGVCVIWTSGTNSEGHVCEWVGTGFPVAPDIPLTNNHVLDSQEVARNATVPFDFERAAPEVQQGRDSPPQRGREYGLNPERLFVASPFDGGLDFTFVGTDQGPAADGAVSRMERAAFVISTGERAFLIHHPAGKPKRAF